MSCSRRGTHPRTRSFIFVASDWGVTRDETLRAYPGRPRQHDGRQGAGRQQQQQQQQLSTSFSPSLVPSSNAPQVFGIGAVSSSDADAIIDLASRCSDIIETHGAGGGGG